MMELYFNQMLTLQRLNADPVLLLQITIFIIIIITITIIIIIIIVTNFT